MWLSLLFVMTILLFLLPLLPALLELQLKQDVSPIRIDQAHAGNIDHFAESFMTFIKQAIDDHQAGRNNALAPESCCLLENDGLFEPTLDELKRSRTNRLIVGTGHLYLPDQFNFTQEIFSEKDIMGGKNDRIRSVLALGDLELGENSELLRWAHARKIKVGAGCILLGRISAEEAIVFQPECEFTRVNARRVYVQSGDSTGIADEVFLLPEKGQKTEVSALQSHVDDSGRVLLNGNLDFPEHGFWKGDLIVRGNALIRREAQIFGNLKVYGQLRIEPGVNITGSIVCNKNIIIADACALGGPLVAESQIDIDVGTRIGASAALTTITAPVIRIASGVTIYGTIWARIRGETLASLGSIEMPRRNPNKHNG
jgi:cytoskeletal protein CcmA (bactofilin family)